MARLSCVEGTSVRIASTGLTVFRPWAVTAVDCTLSDRGVNHPPPVDGLQENRPLHPAIQGQTRARRVVQQKVVVQVQSVEP